MLVTIFILRRDIKRWSKGHSVWFVYQDPGLITWIKVGVTEERLKHMTKWKMKQQGWG
jgi:hypothetical protein